MRLVTLGSALGLVVVLLACKSGSSSSSAPSSSSKTAESEADEPIGKLAGISAADIEARAKKSSYTQKSSDEDKDSGMQVVSLEFESDDNFAYVTLVDLGKDGKAHSVTMGETSGLCIHFDEAPEGKLDAAALAKSLLDKHALSATKRDTLKEDLKALGWEVSSAASDSEDGVTSVDVVADKKDDQVLIRFFDFKPAKSEGRLAVDGNRFLNVFVCEDCTKRKEGVLTDISNRRKARKLLGKLTKS